jgi:hypothetical protein
MASITVRVEDKVEEELRRAAEQRDTTLSELVRSYLVEGLRREPKKLTPYEAWQRIFKPEWDFGHPDDAERSEEILREMFDEKRRRLG